ncbi:MAG: hypothetical protein A2825_03915 [Candidatus Taylorbacteria bacterium RIFCSPHIGHO2_01_FULL_43_120]|nr:MAG: hypothetical protein A2825_03915 [Candidatus Taylorbacteria bacterium RIFCSPHIGHO2_01_FULL_43_120]
MKTATARFIDKRVVRHIARKHYGMTFCEEYAMHRRNQRENTSWPATLAVIMTLVCALACAIIPFKMKGEYWMTTLACACICLSLFLYCAMMLCAQECKYNRWWKQIRHTVSQFKGMIKCPKDNCPPWDELLTRAQRFLTDNGGRIVSLEGSAERALDSLQTLATIAKKDVSRVSERENLLRIKEVENGMAFMRNSVADLKELKENFKGSFYLAKQVLGDSLDNGHGFGAFMRRIEKNANA